MPADWSAEEVAATVADYLAMLHAELRGAPYNKREHNRRLQALLNDRSAPAIEFKHANISAILLELGYPYIDGYKPRGNYQELLRIEVETQLARRPEIARLTTTLVDALPEPVPPVMRLEDVLVDPPEPLPRRRTYEYPRPPHAPGTRLPINYLEREARNGALGAAGERLVLELEHQRLWAAGSRALADRVEHVAQTQGDGLGFDILSFESDGRERLIEVKTTRFGRYTPFFASRREVDVSTEQAAQYHVYRVHRFGADPRLYIRQGALDANFRLDAVQYRASVA